jgi:hypothetical protein
MTTLAHFHTARHLPRQPLRRFGLCILLGLAAAIELWSLSRARKRLRRLDQA